MREEAWRSVCKECGFDYDQLLTAWRDFLYVNGNPLFFDGVKELAPTKRRYQISPNEFVLLKIPTLEDEIEKHRETIAMIRGWFG